MIAAALLYPLLFVFGLICTLISTIPPTKKFLAQIFKSCDRDCKYSSKDAPKLATSFRSDAAAAAAVDGGGSTVELRSVFATFDKNDDGYITKQELRESLKNIGISVEERDVEDMVQKVDSNGDGLIDLDEFYKLFDSISGLDREKQGSEEAGEGRDGDLKEAFDVFDGNKDGLITVEELGLVLSSLGFTEGKKFDDCQEMIRKVDVDGDGMVNFDEFKMMMKAGFGRIIQIS